MKTSRLGILAFALIAVIHAPTASASEEPVSSSTAKRTHERPVDPMDRPNFGIEFTGSPKAFGPNLMPGRKSVSAIGTTVSLEYQPTFLQAIGTFGIGPVLGAYPVSPHQGATSGYFSVWSVGGTARYQARYFHDQLLVPTIGYEADRISYSFTNNKSGNFIAAGPVVGLQLLLNDLDPSRTEGFYDTTTISHTYLLAEMRDLTGTDGASSASDLSWYFGLRFEL